MSRSNTWMPFYIGDYLRDTGHLTTTEHGAYLLLLMQAWTRDGVLPADDLRLRTIAKMDAKEWKRSGCALMEFFQRHGETYRHKRLDRELANAVSMTEQRRAAGIASAEARARKRNINETDNETGNETGNENPTSVGTGASTNDQQTARPSPSQRKKDSELRSGADAPSDPKAELWKDGLATLRRLTSQERGPAGKLLGKLLDAAAADHVRLLELIRRAEVEQPDGPQAWLMAGAKAIGGAPTLPLNALPELPSSFDPPDAWGVRAWVRSLSGVEIGKDQRGNDAYLLAGVCIEDIALDVLNDAKILLTSRPNLEALAGWLRDDLNPKTISAVIRRSAGRSGYEPVGSLAYFDKPVREGHGRAAA